MSSTMKHQAALLVSIVGLALGASSAHADSLTYNGSVYANPPGVSITSPAAVNSVASEFSVTDTTTSKTFNAFCVDIMNTLLSPSTYTPTSLASDGVFTALVKTNIDKLFTQHYAAVNNATTAAAFQEALWRVVYNGSYTGTVNATVDAVALNWATTLGAATGGYNLTVWRTPANVPTSQAEISMTVVPEPETYLLMLSGLGMVGLMTRRRRPEGVTQGAQAIA